VFQPGEGSSWTVRAPTKHLTDLSSVWYNENKYSSRRKAGGWHGSARSTLAQRLSTRAYQALNRVCPGKARRVRFKWQHDQLPALIDWDDPVVKHGLDRASSNTPAQGLRKAHEIVAVDGTLIARSHGPGQTEPILPWVRNVREKAACAALASLCLWSRSHPAGPVLRLSGLDAGSRSSHPLVCPGGHSTREAVCGEAAGRRRSGTAAGE
jgi:hypothetical protein